MKIGHIDKVEDEVKEDDVKYVINSIKEYEAVSKRSITDMELDLLIHRHLKK